jgi:formylglycine-generating enzyme required for sulfatase activity/TolB-like protein
MKRFAVCFVLVFLAGLCYAQQTVVAVFPFVTEGGISQTDANSVTRIFEIKLQATGAIRVVPRSTVDRVIQQEHIYQMSDLSDTAKTAQLRRGLNADWVVWGTVSTIGRDYLITAQLIDLNSQELMGGVPVQMSRIEEAMVRMDGEIEKMTRRLTAGTMGGQATSSSARPAQSSAPPAQNPAPAPEGFVFVRGGAFQMGTASGGNDNERPVHSVTVKSFYLGKYEVTQKEWREIMGTTIRQQRDAADRSWSLYGEGNNYPMYYVSWHEVIEYCNKRSLREGLTPAYRGSGNSVTCDFSATGYRLPTEAEWEYAAKGGDKTYLTTEYSGSNNVESVGWYIGNSGGGTHPVGTKQPNDLGIYDMSGNVWEWCWDWYGAYTGDSQTDPAGPASGPDRVLRGGSWNYSAGLLRSAFRGFNAPTYRDSSRGFRLVRP